ncbi:MAG: response regulator, partial [Myxococcota bacterium]
MPTRVLVVDDEPPIRELLVEYLRGRGLSADAVSTGEEGRARIAQEPWDLVLTDLKLPGIDGIEVLRAAVARDVPTVLMSACGTVESVVEAYALGAREYLSKPFRLRDAWDVVARVLAAAARDRRRAWQSAAF